MICIITDDNYLSTDEKKNLAIFIIAFLFKGGRRERKGCCSKDEAIKSFIDVQPVSCTCMYSVIICVLLTLNTFI